LPRQSLVFFFLATWTPLGSGPTLVDPLAQTCQHLPLFFVKTGNQTLAKVHRLKKNHFQFPFSLLGRMWSPPNVTKPPPPARNIRSFVQILDRPSAFFVFPYPTFRSFFLHLGEEKSCRLGPFFSPSLFKEPEERQAFLSLKQTCLSEGNPSVKTSGFFFLLGCGRRAGSLIRFSLTPPPPPCSACVSASLSLYPLLFDSLTLERFVPFPFHVRFQISLSGSPCVGDPLFWKFFFLRG